MKNYSIKQSYPERMSHLKALLLIMPVFMSTIARTQSLSPKVIATGGGYQTSVNASLSFTIGESVTQTLTASNNMLTQGFQQPLELNLLNVKAFLQGYYAGAGQMTDVLYNEGEYANPSDVADTVTVELHDANPPYALAFQTKSTMKQNGTVNVKGLGVLGQLYYIVLKHRNSVETWSANPVLMGANTNYDFSTSASQAYGDNQVEVETGVWALYSGDINQDGAIDAFDYVILDPDIFNGIGGYISTDLNGDGSVDAFDYLIFDTNVYNGIGAAMP